MSDLSTETIALIPARGGSKSIPYKNIRHFAGHPLIAYSIAAGLAAETVSRVIVSTDDEQIAEISHKYGAEIPFIRPSELALDDTPDLPVFSHALEWVEQNEDYRPKFVVQLRPTSPLRRVAHINQAVNDLISHPDADAIRTVCIPFQNPFKMWRIIQNGYMSPFIDFDETEPNTFREPYNMPRQLLPDVYWQTGYVDAARVDTIKIKKSMTGERILPLVIDPSEWIDIDSVDDWRRAERLLESGEITGDDLGFHLS